LGTVKSLSQIKTWLSSMLARLHTCRHKHSQKLFSAKKAMYGH